MNTNTAFRPARPGVHTDGKWVIAHLKRGWQIYGCDHETYDGPAAYLYTLSAPWQYLKDAKAHVLYLSWWAG